MDLDKLDSLLAAKVMQWHLDEYEDFWCDQAGGGTGFQIKKGYPEEPDWWTPTRDWACAGRLLDYVTKNPDFCCVELGWHTHEGWEARLFETESEHNRLRSTVQQISGPLAASLAVAKAYGLEVPE